MGAGARDGGVGAGTRLQGVKSAVGAQRADPRPPPAGCRPQASYVRRENEYKARIQELEQQVERARAGEGPTDDEQRRFDPIRSMHGQILSHIDEVKGRTAKILRGELAAGRGAAALAPMALLPSCCAELFLTAP